MPPGTEQVACLLAPQPQAAPRETLLGDLPETRTQLLEIDLRHIGQLDSALRPLEERGRLRLLDVSRFHQRGDRPSRPKPESVRPARMIPATATTPRREMRITSAAGSAPSRTMESATIAETRASVKKPAVHGGWPASPRSNSSAPIARSFSRSSMGSVPNLACSKSSVSVRAAVPFAVMRSSSRAKYSKGASAGWRPLPARSSARSMRQQAMIARRTSRSRRRSSSDSSTASSTASSSSRAAAFRRRRRSALIFRPHEGKHSPEQRRAGNQGRGDCGNISSRTPLLQDSRRRRRPARRQRIPVVARCIRGHEHQRHDGREQRRDQQPDKQLPALSAEDRVATHDCNCSQADYDRGHCNQHHDNRRPGRRERLATFELSRARYRNHAEEGERGEHAADDHCWFRSCAWAAATASRGV